MLGILTPGITEAQVANAVWQPRAQVSRVDNEPELRHPRAQVASVVLQRVHAAPDVGIVVGNETVVGSEIVVGREIELELFFLRSTSMPFGLAATKATREETAMIENFMLIVVRIMFLVEEVLLGAVEMFVSGCYSEIRG